MVTASLRIVFFGTPEFAVPTLNALLASQHVVAGIVTQPDRPRGRGQRLLPSPVKEVAEAHGSLVLQPERLRDAGFLQALAGLEADLGVVAAYGRILTADVLAIPRMGLINVHASLLPRYRGAAPIHRAVMAGETQTGITIMRVVQALDAGPMISVVPRPIGPEETSVDVELDLARLGAGALAEAVDLLALGKASERLQEESEATYAPKITKADGVVNWTAPAAIIHNQIRGLLPWPHAYSSLGEERCVFLESRVEAPQAAASAAEPGTILEAHGDLLRVQTGGGVLQILRLQLDGRRPLSAREFLAGRPLSAGTKFVQLDPST